MPRDGSGNFTLSTGNPVVPNTIISSNGWANPTLSDIASALTASIARDGQTTPTANLPMGNFRHTNVANAQSRSDYAAAGQVQDGSMQFLTSIAGSDTITAALPVPPLAAYVAGQRFSFVAAGTNTTTAVTLNINGLGAKDVTKQVWTPLIPGDIAAGQVVTVVYDGTKFQIVSGPMGQSIGVVGSVRNARMYVPVVSSTAVYTVDEVIVQTALGGISYLLKSLSIGINLGTVGAGGMDIGSPPANGFLATYAIYNPTTQFTNTLTVNATSAVAPPIYGGANMPAGFTASALISVWGTDGSGNLIGGMLRDRTVGHTGRTVFTTSSGTSGFAPFNTLATVPRNAIENILFLSTSNTLANAVMSLTVGGDINGIGPVVLVPLPTAAAQGAGSQGVTATSNVGQLWYNASSNIGTPTYTVISLGYKF
ncbi:hypothetical protein PIN31115_02097 [Pandoraea iniqua]|uniref:Uncharacterized protein n=1 Tax=Pandoraea iniqua TaxID=2508288 RepID=A0A5E4ULH7_9BURK|nr:hypothetical protein [Pandoraea iniqua]VVE00898.1 hypothetical protein PIN31115_02097 [Pandoraea iniqua]